MKLQFLKGFLLASILAGGLVSCSDDDNPVVEDLSEKDIRDIISTNQTFEDLFLLAEDLKDDSAGRSEDSGCYSVKKFDFEIQGINKFKFTYDFGTGCTSFSSGKEYKGKLIIEREWDSNGYKRTLTFDGFSADGITLTGVTKFDAKLKNDAGNLEVLAVNDLIFKLKDGTELSRKGNVKLERVEGGKTILNPADDVYETSGAFIVKGLDQVDYGVKIGEKLVTSTNCGLGTIATKGTYEIVKSGKNYVVDFGNGDCDTKITFDGKEIQL